jgi:hypothetical protein
MAYHQFNIRISKAMIMAMKREAKVQGCTATEIARKAIMYYVQGNAGYNRRGAR